MTGDNIRSMDRSSDAFRWYIATGELPNLTPERYGNAMTDRKRATVERATAVARWEEAVRQLAELPGRVGAVLDTMPGPHTTAEVMAVLHQVLGVSADAG